MPQVHALFFELSSLCPAHIDYRQVLDELSQEDRSTIGYSGSIFDLLREKAKKKDGENAREAFLRKYTRMLQETESAQLNQIQLYMGVKNGLASVKTMNFKVGLSSDLDETTVEKFLKEKGIREYFETIEARKEIVDDLNFPRKVKKFLEEANLKADQCVYFCNTTSDLATAKALGLRTIVLPSKFEKANNLLLLKPDGMIITLEEIPNLLSLDTFKDAPVKPEEVKDSQQQSEAAAEEMNQQDSSNPTL